MNVQLMAIEGLPEFGPGADIAALVADGASRAGVPLVRGDILVVTQKIVSKAEGQLVPLAGVTPSPFAAAWAEAHGYDPRLVELVMRESCRIVRMDRGLLITETIHGFVCANSGVDVSNVSGGEVAAVLPRDPDASARRIRDALVARLGHDVAVVISDTFGRPWREGLVNVAIGAAGLCPLSSYVDARDPAGFALKATVQALADEVAAASGLVARKLNRVPAVIVRGVSYETPKGEAGAKDMIRPAERDLFR
jgi:coenzyme F420-0:L-glutamate ligase/coenzyme F420-1:gamma-L-glutamate ligase